MTPTPTEPRHLLIRGDARTLPLADRSVQCCVTSPPYWGLRDYGTARWEGGEPECEHIEKQGGHLADSVVNVKGGGQKSSEAQRLRYRDICRKCGARRVDRQLGLEPTPDAYIARMVEVFREVRRVLRDDGTLWLNIGDSYANDAKWGGATGGKHAEGLHGRSGIGRGKTRTGLKGKDLVGIPWMLAFALRADGWYLRSEIIWSKPNPMPESIRDRPSKAHETVFLLSKRPRYFYDGEAVKERRSSGSLYPGNIDPGQIQGTKEHKGGNSQFRDSGKRAWGNLSGRNSRSVWTITTRPFKGAHFATMPVPLAAACIRAGTSEKGRCPACGAPWRRVVERRREATRPGVDSKVHGAVSCGNRDPGRHCTTTTTLGWESSCGCPGAREPAPCVVLDPFAGACTTAVAAALLGRSSVGVELSADYLALGRERLIRAIANPPGGRPTPRRPRDLTGQGRLF